MLNEYGKKYLSDFKEKVYSEKEDAIFTIEKGALIFLLKLIDNYDKLLNSDNLEELFLLKSSDRPVRNIKA